MTDALRHELEEVLLRLSALDDGLTQGHVQQAIDEHPALAELISAWAMQWWKAGKTLDRLRSCGEN